MARYLGCGICMKVCPIQKYGMKEVMAHYAATGQVLGKGTHDLEGYQIAAKGYFGPGELPLFDRQFFAMPHGRAEDWAFAELKTKVRGAEGIDSPEDQEAMEVFKDKLAVPMSLSDDVLAMELEDYIA